MSALASLAVLRSRVPAALNVRRLESAGALVASLLAAVAASAHLLRRDVVEGDALIHQYWMRAYADPELFTDALTAKLRGSQRYPDGYEALFRLAAQVADPIAFGEWLGVALMAAAGWLVFAVVREHTAWRPAAWIAAGLFLALDGHRFYGGFPRAFVHVVVLATVLLALRRRETAAALVAAAGALFYPPAALLALGLLASSSLRRRGIDRTRVRTTLLAGALAAGAVAAQQVLSGGSFDVMTASEARRYPEFGSSGPLHYFVDSLTEYVRQNRSGFDLRATGSIVALAALALLLVRRANVRLLRAEVLALPVAALGGYLVAQALLFRLYLPHRYTYPLLAFCAIAIGVLLRPTWEALWARRRPRRLALALLAAPAPLAYFAAYAFPLGPLLPPLDYPWPAWLALVAAVLGLAGGAAFALARAPRASRAAIGALLTGLTLATAVAAAPGRRPPGQECAQSAPIRFLATLPKDAVIAGDPIDLRCVPVSARRAVVVSTQLAYAYERAYFHEGRARMFALLRAYYGPSVAALADLGPRFGATHVWVNGAAVRHEAAGDEVRWPAFRQPYGRLVTRLVRAGEPAALRLPAACRRWRRGQQAVYEIRCLRAPGR